MNTGPHSLAKDNVSVDSRYGIVVFSSSFAEAKGNYIYGSKNMPNHDCPV